MILVIDDDSTILSSLRFLLGRAGYETVTASDPESAVDAVRRIAPELILMDMNFTRGTSGREGLELLQKVRIFRPGVPVILMTAWGSIDLAVEGMRAGAFDFITKPWDNRGLLARIETAIGMNSADDGAKGDFDRAGIVGSHSRLEDVLSVVARVAPTDAPVLITGESGTGKELVAEAIHRNSRRAAGPFVKVNLGGISQSLFESEMFGHRKGAFTGAVSDRVGRFEAADGGTIFLDEIGELDAASQVKLLRVLQDHTFEPLGSSRPCRVDVRVVCATNADLPAMVAERTFREDLYYRINLVSVALPPLRDRASDIPALARHFCERLCAANPSLGQVELDASASAFLRGLPFPGNIRELRNLVERTCLLSGHGVLTADDFRACHTSAPAQPRGTLGEMERARIAKALADARGNISQAAASLGLTRQALYRRMEKYGLN
ncbi:MAG: sigma-54 dependent transcriptional regulator [Muribaculaceae bacterium]|nr:sigma-54 dependent transcriptional regulator [Muribaculaceae bacterium]